MQVRNCKVLWNLHESHDIRLSFGTMLYLFVLIHHQKLQEMSSMFYTDVNLCTEVKWMFPILVHLVFLLFPKKKNFQEKKYKDSSREFTTEL